MIVETTTLICIKDLYIKGDDDKENVLLYSKNKEYKFVRVNKSEWVCRDEEVLALSMHFVDDDSLQKNFLSREDIRNKNICELF